jgi:hypothetical protein
MVQVTVYDRLVKESVAESVDTTQEEDQLKALIQKKQVKIKPNKTIKTTRKVEKMKIDINSDSN